MISSTIDEKHRQITAELNRNRTEIVPNLKEELNQLQNKLAKEDIKAEEKQRVCERQRHIQKKIRSIRRKEQDYLLTNSRLIHEYFANKKNIGMVEGNKTVLEDFFQSQPGLPTPNVDAKKQSTVEKYFANVDDRFLDMKILYMRRMFAKSVIAAS